MKASCWTFFMFFSIYVLYRSLIMDYEQLRQNTRGNGETNCILCGHDPLVSEKKLQLIACDKCGKVNKRPITCIHVLILINVLLVKTSLAERNRRTVLDYP